MHGEVHGVGGGAVVLTYSVLVNPSAGREPVEKRAVEDGEVQRSTESGSGADGRQVTLSPAWVDPDGVRDPRLREALGLDETLENL